MAFGKKYFCEYKSSNNLDYYVEIWVEGQILPAVEIEIGASGPIIEYDTEKIDRFSPIISSSCRFPFVVTDFQLEQFVDLLRTLYQEREVYLHLYRSSQANYASVSPLWSGYLVMDLGSGVDKSYPYEQELLFTDGLSLLKDVDWVDLSVSGSTTNTAGNYVEDNMYYGPGRFTFWLREILRKTGAATTAEGSTQDYRFTTAINWYNGLNSQIGTSSDPLYLTKCSMSLFFTKDDNGVFYPDNTYNVLKQILKHWGARITYWKHQFWIVQIPEYITAESGTLAAPVNINSRVYSESGAYQGSQPHLGSTYWTRYEQAIQNQKISKLAGTKYNYLPAIKNVYADFLSFSSKNYYGGFPFGLNATDTEIFQGTINNPSAADFLWLSIPLDFNWDMGTSQLTNGHTMGWWAYIRFNFYAAQKDPSTGIITTYYLQYKSSDGSYYWVDSANWKPLGNEAPKYTIKSKNISETNYIGFEEKIEFIDSTGSNIDMNGAWSFYFDISDYGGKGSFYCNFSGYGSPRVQRRPQQPIVLPAPNGFGTTTSGRVLWSNSLEDVFGTTTINTGNPNPSGFNAGTATDDFSLQTSSPFKGLLQLLMNQAGTSFGDSLITLNNDSKDSEEYKFGELLWGDAIEYAQSSLQVFNGTSFVPTSPSGEWARGSLAGNKTFTKLLIDEFFSGQIKVVITPSMRLAVGENNQTETISGVSRPRYVNPIGILREFNFRGFDPVYFFRRGAFFTAFDEWDYEGYQIIRDAVPSTTTINNIGNLGGSQIAQPFSNSRLTNPTTQALAMNSPVAYVRQTIPSTGSNVAVNGNFNVAVGWNVGTGWSIDTTSKKAIFTATGSESDLSQSVLTQGLTYQINFRVVITSGTLLVKAGSSGTTQTITTSDDYSIYLECEGSSLIKFQAGTTFTGNITYITIAEQKSLSSLPIQSIGTSVFKIGDTFNLINPNNSEILPLTVTANQGANDVTISVVTTPLYEDIHFGSTLLLNQVDLSEQYQNKTKGTVAGYGITATGIAKSGINITGWLNSDSMTGAAITNVPTALSVKNYVDGQVGASDTLQEVTDNGNTTTNSIMIGSSSSPSALLEIQTAGTSGSQDFQIFSRGVNPNYEVLKISRSAGNTDFLADQNITLSADYDDNHTSNNSNIIFKIDGDEHMRIIPGGNVGIGTTDPIAKLHINDASGGILRLSDSTATVDGEKIAGIETGVANGTFFAGINFFRHDANDGEIRFRTKANNINTDVLTIVDGNIGIGTTSPSEKLHVVGDALISGDSHADAFKPAVAANPIKFKNFASTEVGRFTDGGNFGIGTSSPISLLHLANTTGGTIFMQDTNVAATNNITSLSNNGGNLSQVTRSSNGNYLATDYQAVKNTLGVNYHRWFTNGDNERLRITSTGGIAFGGATNYGTSGQLLKSNANASPTWVDASTVIGGPYLPLAGGTLTGGLTGTTASFSGNGTFGNGGTTGTDAILNINGGSGSGGEAYLSLKRNNVSGFILNHTATEIQVRGLANIPMYFYTNGTIRQTITSGGNLLIGTTTDSGDKLQVNGNIRASTSVNPTVFADRFSGNGVGVVLGPNNSGTIFLRPYGVNYSSSQSSFTTTLATIGTALTGTTATFTGLVSGITPTVDANFATKGYVDAQVESADTLQEVTDNGNTTTNNIMIGSSSSPIANLHIKDSSTSSDVRIEDSTGNTTLYLQSQNGIGVIGTISSHSLRFDTNDVEKMRLTSGGNLLIGTTSDNGRKLQVNGTSSFSKQLLLNSPDYADQFAIRRGVYGFDIITTGTRIDFSPTSSTDTFKFLGKLQASGVTNLASLTGTTATFSGQVTIPATPVATTDAASKSYVDAQVSATDSLQEVTTIGNTTTNSIKIGSSSSPNAALDVNGELFVSNGGYGVKLSYSNGNQTGIIDTFANHNLEFRINNSEKMVITSGGNLGVGTSSPGEKFAVNGNATYMEITHPTASSYSGIKFSEGGTPQGSIQNIGSTFATVARRGNFEIFHNTSGNLTLQHSGGNVGIGTTSPGYKLDVNGSFHATNVTVADGIYHEGDTNNYISFGTDTQIFTTSGSEKMRITSAGNVLIGTTTDSGYKLDVAGTSNFTGALTGTTGQFTGIGVATTPSAVYKLDVNGKARVQSVLELDDVLTLNAISTPADPASGKSSIWMDTSGDIKVKINVSGTIVTRTIAAFE